MKFTITPEYHEQYLKDAVLSFKLATSSVRDETQIHIHMYIQFGQIIHAIHDLDADVISIETSLQPWCDLIKDFEDINYDLGIGLGVYGISS